MSLTEPFVTGMSGIGEFARRPAFRVESLSPLPERCAQSDTATAVAASRKEGEAKEACSSLKLIRPGLIRSLTDGPLLRTASEIDGPNDSDLPTIAVAVISSLLSQSSAASRRLSCCERRSLGVYEKLRIINGLANLCFIGRGNWRCCCCCCLIKFRFLIIHIASWSSSSALSEESET
jgi:hypothetical protein